MKKVCFLLRTSCGGGAERVAVRLANYFADKGYFVTYAFYYHTGDYFLNNSIEKKTLCEKAYKNKIHRTLYELKSTRVFFNSHYFDDILIFGYSPAIEFYASHPRKKNRKRVIVSERNDPNRNIKKRYLLKAREWAYKKADAVVYQTIDAKCFFSKLKLSEEYIIPNPIEDISVSPFSGQRRKSIVTAGRLTEQKNIMLLIDAFASFLKVKPDYLLEIYGDGEQLHSLKCFCKEREIDKYVLFKGFSTNLLNDIVDSAMYISSSNYEGISNSILEALALGIPTIATDCPIGGSRLLITNQVNGLLVPVRDKQSLLDAMLLLDENKELSNKISKEAIRVREKYHISNIAENWIKLL